MDLTHDDDLTQYIDQIPPPEVIRDRLSRNLREARLLRQLLRISEQRNRLKEVADAK